jgi:hypothetical protein
MGTPHQLEPLRAPGAPPASDPVPGGRARPAPLTLPTLDVDRRGRTRLAPGEAPPPATEPAPPPPPPAPSFDEAELAKAMAHACQQGAVVAAAAVRAELVAAVEHRTSLAVEAIAAELARSQAQLTESRRARAGASRALALALARAILPRALADRPLADIEAMLIDLVGRLDGQPRLELWVAPDLVAAATALLARVAADAGHDGALALHPDPTLGPGDARLTWVDGVALRDLAALEREAVALVDAWLSSAGVAATEPPTTALDPEAAEPPGAASSPNPVQTLEAMP